MERIHESYPGVSYVGFRLVEWYTETDTDDSDSEIDDSSSDSDAPSNVEIFAY